MKTINRTAITIFPKQPYIDWANNFNDVTVYYKEAVTTILIPDEYDEFNCEKFIKKTYKQIFEEQLESWITDPDVWPKKRDYKTFKKWFDVLCSDMTWDYGDGDIEHDEN